MKINNDLLGKIWFISINNIDYIRIKITKI